jgi:hypothetical protein
VYRNWCWHAQEIILLPLPDGRVTFVPVSDSETIRYVGRCIYCGTARLPLSDEHILAYGLLPREAPPWLLRSASCAVCRNTTSFVERTILRKLWLPARAGLRLRSYRKRSRETTYPLEVERAGGEFDEVWVPSEEYPAAVMFPTFALPAHLDGRSYGGGIDVNGLVTVQVAGPSAADVARRLGTKTLRYRSTFEKATYERLLLKVAYGIAVAQRGLNGIESVYILDALMGRSDDIGRWLGCDGETMLNPAALHAAATYVFNGDIVCRLRLLSALSPEYVIVVGRAGADQPSPRHNVVSAGIS